MNAASLPVAAGRDRSFAIFTAVVSAVALGFLFWLLVWRQASPTGADLRFLPAVNASFNAMAAALLSLGFVFIKQGKAHLHKYAMVGAFAMSGLFLVSYVVYHYTHGDTKFVGQGIVRPIYFFVLITHVVLSAVTLPLVFSSFFFSLSGRFPAHKKVSKATAPLWLYVSVTGVVVFAMLKIWNP